MQAVANYALHCRFLQAVSVALPLSGCIAKGMMTQSAAGLTESGPGCVAPLAAKLWQVLRSQQLCAARGVPLASRCTELRCSCAHALQLTCLRRSFTA